MTNLVSVRNSGFIDMALREVYNLLGTYFLLKCIFDETFRKFKAQLNLQKFSN